MYEKMDPSMPGFIFSAGYYLVAAVSLGILSRMSSQPAQKIDGNALMSNKEESGMVSTRGGWELGSYLFIGNGLQVVGLQTVPADRAVPLQTWVACVIAFAGVVIMGADGNKTGVDATNGAENTAMLPFDNFDLNELISSLLFSQGDFLIVLAALAYTMHVVRLGVYAPQTTPLKLAASKATTEAVLSVALVLGLIFVGNAEASVPEFVSQTGSEVVTYFKTIGSSLFEGAAASVSAPTGQENSLAVSIAAILWTGWLWTE
ncbi:predicted protein [Thalassiosira pseudonana CCMP1335]|uniref:Uncharacterized protein n=1 Tax=Thalassiosira pseudonana TaxID=35128 RepID=B8C5D0_THAPS|nr:predicted protein [Thalassiosira pseudonana CCMP1335]EED91096.1 predicted protein [Thalassiosira pseudonana CCMP1335]